MRWPAQRYFELSWAEVSEVALNVKLKCRLGLSWPVLRSLDQATLGEYVATCRIPNRIQSELSRSYSRSSVGAGFFTQNMKGGGSATTHFIDKES